MVIKDTIIKLSIIFVKLYKYKESIYFKVKNLKKSKNRNNSNN